MVCLISKKLSSWGSRLEEAPFFSGLLAVTQWVESAEANERLSQTDKDSFDTMLRFSAHIVGEENYHPQSWELVIRRVAERKSIADESLNNPLLGVYGIDSIENEEQAFYTLYSVFEEKALFLSPASALTVIDMMCDYGVRGIFCNTSDFYETYNSPSQSSPFYVLRKHPNVLGLLLAMSMTPHSVEDFQELVVKDGAYGIPDSAFAAQRNHLISMAKNVHQQQPGLREGGLLAFHLDVLETAKSLCENINVDELEAALQDTSGNDVMTCSSFNVPSLCLWRLEGLPGEVREHVAQKYSVKAMAPCRDGESSDDLTAYKPGSNVLAFHREDDGSLLAVGAVSMSLGNYVKMRLYSLVKNASETTCGDVVPKGLSFLLPQDDAFEAPESFAPSEKSLADRYLKNVVADGVSCSTSRVAFL